MGDHMNRQRGAGTDASGRASLVRNIESESHYDRAQTHGPPDAEINWIRRNRTPGRPAARVPLLSGALPVGASARAGCTARDLHGARAAPSPGRALVVRLCWFIYDEDECRTPNAKCKTPTNGRAGEEGARFARPPARARGAGRVRARVSLSGVANSISIRSCAGSCCFV